MTLKVIGSLLNETFNQWLEDKAPRLGAALAYYALFSLAPLLIIVIGIAGLVAGEQKARGQLVRELKETAGEPMAGAIEGLLKSTHETGGSSLATIGGFAILLFGATGLFVQLQDALNTIWKVTPKPGRPILSMLRDRLLSFALVLGSAFLLLLLLVISAILAAFHRLFPPNAFPIDTHGWQAFNVLLSFAFCTLLFAMIYKILPDVRIAWREVWIGAAVTALLFTAGKYLLSLYLGWSSTTSAFGTAASLVIVLLWVYYSAQIFLFGAEFTRAYADRFGSQICPTKNAVRITREQLARQGIPRTEDVEAAARAQRPTNPDAISTERPVQGR
ncbi:MAG TPA: YihY/virulence factor BrkB family protein [Gemmataceae bacterium]|nr:YihY/virulence factor BrkB family protein [Gemmataceae bacterium]